MRQFQDVFHQLNVFTAYLTSAQLDLSSSSIVVSKYWDVLGPFTIGTREASWGSDPLESIGGFHSLTYNETSHFKSSLNANGTIKWTNTVAEVTYLQDDAVAIELQVGFPQIDWTFLQQIYGWAALQWQGWARGYVTLQTEELYSLDANGILEFRIDDNHYFGGDFYGFNRASMLLRLGPGRHKIDLRLVRDVRSMGGMTSSPIVKARLLLAKTTRGLHQVGQILFPDRLIDWKGPLSSTYASVVLRNDNDVDIFIRSLEARHNTCQAELVATRPVRLVPGQSRPVAFQVDCIPGTSAYLSIDLHFGYHLGTDVDTRHNLFVGILARPPMPLHEPHVITYLHPGGIVSYAMLKPPAINCTDQDKLPVLLALHGAGVEVDSEQSKHSLDEVADLCAWTLLPSGVTTWSGDDWHNWGWADVEAAIDSISAWIDKTEWNGPGVDSSRWLVVGHSNGGQGVWYALTHHPDKIIAAAPVSGYSSIQNYVPYTFWYPADPGRTAIAQAQLSNYRHELLLDNTKGIPIFQQHGSLDGNVPVFHSRLMYGMVPQADAHSAYLEVPGKNHWWDGVLTTPALQHFYRRSLSGASTQAFDNFTVVTVNPADTSGKNGITILALTIPGQPGRLAVGVATGCSIKSQNVDAFEISGRLLRSCSALVVDGTLVEHKHQESADRLMVDRRPSGTWEPQHPQTHSCVRTSTQHGGLEAIFRTNGTLHVVQHSQGNLGMATQVANNLLQYLAADVAFATSYDEALAADGNIISLAYGSDLPPSKMECAEMCRILPDDHGRFTITRNGTVLDSFDLADNEIVAAAYLRPLPSQRLELVFWATDLASLNISTRLLPLLTGSGQPDLTIATRKMLSHGLEGAFALGFFNGTWCPSTNSFFATGTKL